MSPSHAAYHFPLYLALHVKDYPAAQLIEDIFLRSDDPIRIFFRNPRLVIRVPNHSARDRPELRCRPRETKIHNAVPILRAGFRNLDSVHGAFQKTVGPIAQHVPHVQNDRWTRILFRARGEDGHGRPGAVRGLDLEAGLPRVLEEQSHAAPVRVFARPDLGTVFCWQVRGKCRVLDRVNVEC